MKICDKVYRVGRFYKVPDSPYKFKLRHKFDWPEGYFGDSGKCWHSYNNATPTLFQDNGAKWLTIYKNEKSYARCGILPLSKEQWLIFNLTTGKSRSDALHITKVANWFINDEYSVIPKIVTNDVYRSFAADYIFYTNGSVVIHKNGTYPIGSVSFDETGYGNRECDGCGYNYVYKYEDEHICGQHHYIAEEFKK